MEYKLPERKEDFTIPVTQQHKASVFIESDHFLITFKVKDKFITYAEKPSDNSSVRDYFEKVRFLAIDVIKNKTIDYLIKDGDNI